MVVDTPLIFGIVALAFGAVALGGALSNSPIVSGGFGLAAGIMGLVAGIINGKGGNNKASEMYFPEAFTLIPIRGIPQSGFTPLPLVFCFFRLLGL